MKKEIKLTQRQQKLKAEMDNYFEYMNEPKKPFDEIKDQDVAGFQMYKEYLKRAKAMTELTGKEYYVGKKGTMFNVLKKEDQ